MLLRTQGKNQLLVAATDLNVSLTAELRSHNAADGGITLGAKNPGAVAAGETGCDGRAMIAECEAAGRAAR